jgi:acyl carrier protein
MDFEEFRSAVADMTQAEGTDLLLNTPVADFAWDSLAKISFVSFLDEEFQIECAIDELETIQTFGDMVARVCDRLVGVPAE